MTTTSSNDSLLQQMGPETELWSPSQNTHRKAQDVLANKIVLLYFSASWCPPCARFSPILKTLYKKLKADGDHDFELVFVSLDKTQDAYDKYTSDMPWYCLGFQSPLLHQLGNLYGGGQGLSIPLLVILDKDGTLMVPDGVSAVSTDPEGTKFPWRPEAVVELLPEYYLDHDNNLNPMAELDDKYLMLYFSAHWCPPCKAFTPKLSKAYTELKQSRDDDFELLFVSSDRSEAEFTEYFGTMTFPAIPYHEREAKAGLSSRLQVRGIPTLIMFGPRPADGGGDRPLINANVRGPIEQGSYVADFPFAPKQYGDLNGSSENINNRRCVVVFHEGGDDEEQEEVAAAVTEAAQKSADQNLRFYWATDPAGLSKAVREAVKLGPIQDEPVMVLLDIPDRGAFYVSAEKDVTVESILAFVENPGERQQL